MCIVGRGRVFKVILRLNYIYKLCSSSIKVLKDRLPFEGKKTKKSVFTLDFLCSGNGFQKSNGSSDSGELLFRGRSSRIVFGQRSG